MIYLHVMSRLEVALDSRSWNPSLMPLTYAFTVAYTKTSNWSHRCTGELHLSQTLVLTATVVFMAILAQIQCSTCKLHLTFTLIAWKAIELPSVGGHSYVAYLGILFYLRALLTLE